MADRVPGRVILVGGGPGADDLTTVRGLDRLMAADVVITDRLAPIALLSRLGPAVEIIHAGRAPGTAERCAPTGLTGPCSSQASTAALG